LKVTRELLSIVFDWSECSKLLTVLQVLISQVRYEVQKKGTKHRQDYNE